MKKEIFKNITLLYVEDDYIIRQSAVEYLSHYFNEVLEASNGLEALALMKRYKVDIVITDIQMPKLDGLQLAKKIRKEDKKTQIIIATAFTHKEYLIEAIELQLVKYMIKPILESKLLEVLYACVHSIKEQSSNIKWFSSEVCFDTFNKSLVSHGKIKKLTKNELLFLELLCDNIGRTVTYEEIEQRIWYDSFMSGDALRSFVTALRKKLPSNSIENFSGVGYKVNVVY
jgi:DNA-binding response OmpR family regulator